LIYKSMTNEWSSVLAYKFTEELMAKYQPQDTITRVEIRQMLNRVSMKKDEDHLNKLAASGTGIARQPTIHDGDLIAVVLDAAPKEYQSILTAEQRFKGSNLMLSDLESAMNQHWRQIGHAKSDNNNDDNELNLTAFGVTCFVCHKKGH